MDLELLKLLANAGVPAVLLFYLVWQGAAFSKQLLERLTGLTEKIDRLGQDLRQFQEQAQQTTLRAVEEVVEKLVKSQDELVKVLLQLLAKR